MGKVKAMIDSPEGGGRATDISVDGEQAVILFGTDEGGRAHASRFPLADLELVERAAGLMGFRVLKVTTPEMRATASELAMGRIFGGTGRAFVPYTKTAVFDALCGFEGAWSPAAPPEPDDPSSLSFASVPQDRASITAGSLVLALCSDGSGAWYEAVIIEARADEMLVCKWRFWPDDGAFVRRPNALALLPAPQ